jgi:hypothetical protein
MPTGLILFDGDSQTQGRGTFSYPTLVMNILGNPAGLTITNIPVGGEATHTVIARMPTAVFPAIAASAGPTKIYSCWVGTNDLFYGEAPIHAFNRYRRICAEARVAGAKVICGTPMSRSDTGTPSDYEANRQAFATLVRNGWQGFADAMVDIAADPTIGIAGAELNPTYNYFNSDKVHIGDLGLAHIAPLFADAIRPFLL